MKGPAYKENGDPNRAQMQDRISNMFCTKARKRKERHESTSSVFQERKVVRSNSEERPKTPKHVVNIRRVSSNENFQSVVQNDESSSFDNNDIILMYDEEHERQRCYERFSKPLTSGRRRRQQRYSNKSCHLVKIPPPTQLPSNQSSSAVDQDLYRTIQLDLSTLHKQIDSSEPLLSSQCLNDHIDEFTETLPSPLVASNRLLSSPRNSIIAMHRIYLDPDVPQNVNSKIDDLQMEFDTKLGKLSKQIDSVKRKIRKFESEYEQKMGYNVSQADKLNDKTLRKLYAELNKLENDQKELRNFDDNTALYKGGQQKAKKSFQGTVTDIEKRLQENRDNAERSSELENLSDEQLLDEKVAVQKALLYLESVHGRPSAREDRDMVRHIYERYRTLKRMLAKITISGNQGEQQLDTIHEDETITSFVCTNVSSPKTSGQQIVTQPLVGSSSSTITDGNSDSDSNNTVAAAELITVPDNFHALSRHELLQEVANATEAKKSLKRSIKKFEANIKDKCGRMVQKDDKSTMEHVYVTYKKAKAKLRLLDALLRKHQ